MSITDVLPARFYVRVKRREVAMRVPDWSIRYPILSQQADRHVRAVVNNRVTYWSQGTRLDNTYYRYGATITTDKWAAIEYVRDR